MVPDASDEATRTILQTPEHAIRFYRKQRAMVRIKVWGFTLVAIAVCAGLFILTN